MRTLVGTNYANDPRAIGNNVGFPNYVGWQNSRWFGNAPGAGFYDYRTNRIDGPIPEITSYVHKEWTVSPPGAGDNGFGISRAATIGTNSEGWLIDAGETITISAYLRSNRSNIGPVIWDFFWHQADGTYISRSVVNTQIIPDTGWNRYSATVTAPALTASVGIVFDIDTAVPVWQPGDYLQGTGILLEKGSVLNDYYDGSLMEEFYNLYKWTGTPNESPSQKYRIVDENFSPAKALMDAQRDVFNKVLGPNPVRTLAGSFQDVKYAALEKVLKDNALII